MNTLNGLDGKSVLIGALVVGGVVATQGGLLPVLLVGGLVYLIGSKQGFWGNGPRRWDSGAMRHRAPGAPAFFEEWHRQAHAADTAHQTRPGQPAAYQPAAPAPATAPAPAQPPAAEVRIPVTPAPAAPGAPSAPEPAASGVGYHPTAGEAGASPA